MPKAAKIFGGSSDKRRGSSSSRGYNAAHRVRRQQCLQRANYICECPGCSVCVPACRCEQLATVADHIIPHRGNKSLLEDLNNHQALCTDCHNAKTRSGK